MVVKKIVVTGGPCSGKTTALADLSDYFETIGWKVVIVGNVVAEAAADGIQRDDFGGTLGEPFTYRLRHFLIDCPDTSNFDAAHGVRKSNISRLSYVSKCGEDTCIQHESRGNGYFSVFTKATKRHEPGANSFFITENRISPEDYFCILQGLPESRLSSETRYTIPRCNNQLLLDISIDDTAEDNSAILTVRMAPAMTDADAFFYPIVAQLIVLIVFKNTEICYNLWLRWVIFNMQNYFMTRQPIERT